MSCVKKYYAENGQESLLFNNLLEQYGEWRAEEIYLKAQTNDFKDFVKSQKPVLDSNGEVSSDFVVSFVSSQQVKAQKLSDSEIPNNFIKSGVVEVFESNSELESIGTIKQYSKYLDTIFPTSKVKDIVYHYTNELFDKFTTVPVAKFFTKSTLGGRKYRILTLLNITNPKIFNEFTEDDEMTYGLAEMYSKNKEKDGIINGTEGRTRTEYVVFNPEQIHILGSKQDIDGFRNYVNATKVKQQVKLQKLSDSEIANNLINSSVDKISEAKDDGYTVLGKNLSRVSSILDRDGFAPYRGTSSGQQFEVKGTRYHNIMQDVVNGKPVSQIKSEYSLQDGEIGFVNQIQKFVSDLKSKGGTVIAELKIASMDADSGNGIAGTIDLVHILPSGKAVVYDLKTVHSKGWDPTLGDYYKAKRYTYQTMFYAEMLQKGDAELSRVPVPVEDIFVIPVEITYGASTDEVLAVSMRPAENIKTDPKWKVGKKSFYDKFRNQVNDMFYGTKKSKKTKTDFEKRNVTSFLNSIFKVEDWNISSNLDQRAINLVERQGLKAKSFRTNDGATHEWESDDKNKRIEQAKKALAAVDGKHNELVTENLKDFFNKYSENSGEAAESYSYSLNTKSEVVTARTQRVIKIFKSGNAQEVELVPGYDDVVLIKRADGTYDILTLTDVPLDREIPIKYTASMSKFRGQYRTLFGNYLTPFQANKMRANVLKNTYGDFQKLRLGLIGLELIKENPDIKINRVIVDFVNGTSEIFAQPSNMSDIVGQVKIMHSIPEIKDAEPEVIRQLLDDPSIYSQSKFGDDPIADLYEYLTNQWDTTNKNIIPLKEAIEAYQKDQLLADELAKQILESDKGIVQLIRNKYPNLSDKDLVDKVSTDETFQAMARAYVSLKGFGIHPEADVSNEFMGFITNWVRSPQMTGRKMLDKFYDVFRYHLNEVKRKIDSFIQQKDPYIQALIEEDPVIFRGLNIREKNVLGLDALTGMTRRVFEPLIQTRTDGNGNVYKVPLLIEEGSAEFLRLTKAQQNFIKFFNDTVQKHFKGWKRGQIPMMEISSDSLLYKSKKELTKGDLKKAAEDFKTSISTFWEMASEKGNFRTEAEMNKRMGDFAHDPFASQVIKDSEGEFTTNTLHRFGLNQDMSLFDPSKADTFEIDLEKVLTLFSASYVRKEEMDKALPKYRFFRSLFKWMEINYGASNTYSGSITQENSIKQIDDYVADLAFNIKQGEDKIASKWINLGIRLASISFVGLNWKVFVGNSVQMGISNISDAFVNTVTNDPRFAGMKEFTKAVNILSQASTNEALSRKIHYLRRMYLPEDTGVLISIKGQKAARGMLNEQTAYMIDRSMELGFKEHMLVAQMLKDGTWDAHDITVQTDSDGFRRWQIKYDPKKDPRFSGEDGKAFYQALKAAMVEKGEIAPDEEITSAYDWRLKERLKAYISRAIGTFDRDLSSPWARYSLMHAISQFRNWFRDKFWRSTITEYDAEIFGQYKKGEDGNYYWAAEPMKGMLKTLLDFGTMPKQFIEMARKGDLSLEDKKNLWYAGTSLVTFSTLTILSLALLTDDDDEEFVILKAAISAGQDEVMGAFILQPFLNVSVSPLVFASYFQRLFKTTIKAMAYGTNADFEKMYNTFIDVVPVANQLPDDLIKFEED